MFTKENLMVRILNGSLNSVCEVLRFFTEVKVHLNFFSLDTSGIELSVLLYSCHYYGSTDLYEFWCVWYRVNFP